MIFESEYINALWFFLVMFLITWGSEILGLPEILANVASGIICGPAILHWIEHENHSFHILEFLGLLGIALLLLGSGLECTFEKMVELGDGALKVGVLGTALPWAFAFIIMKFLFGSNTDTAVATATAFSPTSVSIALQIFEHHNLVGRPIGQTMLLAAVTDDILSIMGFTIVLSLYDTDSEGGFLGIFISIGCSILMVLVSFGIGRYVVPKYLAPRLGEYAEAFGQTERNHLQLVILMATMGIMMWVAHLFGSEMLGAFCAGILFCELPRSENVWQAKTSFLSGIFLRIFFSVNVGAAIDTSKLFNLTSFWKGCVLFIGPGMLAKFLAGFFVDVDPISLGIAMIGRGEFAFLIMNECQALGLIPGEYAGAIIWALLFAIVVCPILLEMKIDYDAANKKGKKYLYANIKCPQSASEGMSMDALHTFHHNNLKELNVHITKGDGHDDFEYHLFSHKYLDEEDIEELVHKITDLIDHEGATIEIKGMTEREFEMKMADRNNGLVVVHHYEHAFRLHWTLPDDSDDEAEMSMNSMEFYDESSISLMAKDLKNVDVEKRERDKNEPEKSKEESEIFDAVLKNLIDNPKKEKDENEPEDPEKEESDEIDQEERSSIDDLVTNGKNPPVKENNTTVTFDGIPDNAKGGDRKSDSDSNKNRSEDDSESIPSDFIKMLQIISKIEVLMNQFDLEICACDVNIDPEQSGKFQGVISVQKVSAFGMMSNSALKLSTLEDASARTGEVSDVATIEVENIFIRAMAIILKVKKDENITGYVLYDHFENARATSFFDTHELKTGTFTSVSSQQSGHSRSSTESVSSQFETSPDQHSIGGQGGMGPRSIFRY